MSLKLLKHEIIYDGRVFKTVVDEIEYESGNRATREIAVHSGGAVVLPLLEDRRIIFVRQFRYPLNESLYELPAGKLEPNESPEACAKRELEEETGYRAGKIERLTSIYTSPGFCTERLHVFMATELTDGVQRLEEGELGLTLKIIRAEEAFQMVRTNQIVDAKSIVGLFFLHQKFTG